MKLRTKLAVGAVIALAATGALGTAASATDQSNPPPFRTDTPALGTTVGTLDGPAKAEQNGIEFKVKGDVDVAAFELNYPVGSYSGWHKHPGIVIAVVKTGIVWRQIGCTATKFEAGESFTEAAPHYVSNYYRSTGAPKAVTAVLEITQIYPKGASPLRINQPAPRCPYGIRYVE